MLRLPDPRGLGRPSERGFALLAVFWIVVLLALIASATLHEYRRDLHLTRNILAIAQAEALAGAGLKRAVFELLRAPDGQSWRSDGTRNAFIHDGVEIVVVIEDEGGKLDLNRADRASLLAVFDQINAATDLNNGMVDAILQRRVDQMDTGGFTSLVDLLGVLGIDRTFLNRISTLLTVHTGDRDFDPLAAHPDLLGALRGLDTDQLAVFLEDRDRRAAIAPYRSNDKIYTVRATITTPEGADITRQTIVSLTPRSGALYAVLESRRLWE